MTNEVTEEINAALLRAIDLQKEASKLLSQVVKRLKSEEDTGFLRKYRSKGKGIWL